MTLNNEKETCYQRNKGKILQNVKKQYELSKEKISKNRKNKYDSLSIGDKKIKQEKWTKIALKPS